MAQASLDLIDTMYEIAKAMQPITGRGVGYQLFARKLIPSMSTRDMKRVYRLLGEARERGRIPWEWIVDETRSLEKASSWKNPQEFIRVAKNSYRRDFWDSQPVRVEVWSEKGTVRGLVAPILDDYGVGFRVLHGFSGKTTVYNIASSDDSRPLHALYVGDWDPSGLCMSEIDLPKRLDRYGGDHVKLQRVALVRGDLDGLLSFPASDKRKDPRYKWFAKNYGDRCWELDAMNPNDLRSRVGKAIKALIEPAAWRRCELLEAGEQKSLREALNSWNGRTKRAF